MQKATRFDYNDGWQKQDVEILLPVNFEASKQNWSYVGSGFYRDAFKMMIFQSAPVIHGGKDQIAVCMFDKLENRIEYNFLILNNK